MDGIKETVIVDLPKEEYIHVEKDGKIFTYCTMRQKALHTIGFNSSFPRRRGRLYTRNGKKYFRSYRNYFYGNDSDLDKLVEAGYMESYQEIDMGREKTYWFNRNGLDWLGEQIGVYIYDEEF